MNWNKLSDLSYLVYMYCRVCGTGEQEVDSYCRNCGQFLTDYSARSFVFSRFLGGSTPHGQVNFNLAISLITILSSFLLIGFLQGYFDARQDRTGEAAPSIIYVVYVFLGVVAAWQVLSLIVNGRLKSKLHRRTGIDSSPVEPANAFSTYKTRELLSEGEPLQTTPLIHPDRSTELLKEPRKQ